MTFSLREAAGADAPALAALQTAVWPEHGTTAEAITHEDAELRGHPLGPHLWRWVAEDGGAVVGAASAVQYPGMFHPDRYHADLLVHPQAQGRGVGRALADALEAHLEGRGAREVLAGTQEDCPRGLALLARHGFAEAMRFFDNVLDLSTFDSSSWQDAARLPEGLRLVSLAALSGEVGEDAAWRAYHAAFSEAREDVPRTGEATPLTFEAFRTRGEHPQALPEGVLFAVTDTGEIAALTELELDATDPARLQTGLTGTRRAHRRRGLALALKLAAIELARGRGAASLWTGNASSNVPMLALNDRLGFVRQPAWIEMKRGGV